MRPVRFAESNATYGVDQPEYIPLPAHKSEDGTVTSCWELSLRERLAVLLTGGLWLRQMTFNQHLQPILPQVEKPEFE